MAHWRFGESLVAQSVQAKVVAVEEAEVLVLVDDEEVDVVVAPLIV